MRLICPNCEAQYEVSDDAIPAGGHDVQCSSCQQSWFQTEKPTIQGRDASKLIKPKLPNAVKDTKAEPEEASDPDTPPEFKRKNLDNTVAGILRDEAKRQGAFPGPKTPKPPATQDASPPKPVDKRETLQRIAKMTYDEGGTPAGQSVTAAAASAANVRSIPDINEINATLRARAEASDTSGLTEMEKFEVAERGGFRRGFFFILILFTLLILPYVFADQITENLPQTRGFMATYVTAIDQLRIQFNAFISDLTSG